MVRAIFQTGASALGLLGIVLIWMATVHFPATERKQALQGALQNTANLARAFEEHIVRSLKSVDQTLLYIRDSYEKNPAAFDMSVWTQNMQALTDLNFQIALLDRDGITIGSNLMASNTRLDLSDREHFLVHRNSSDDVLFVSKPVLGRASHKWSIQLTRKMMTRDGRFDGVVVMSLDPQYLSKFYQAVDLGSGGAVSLLGVDGVIRARSPQSKDEGGPTTIGNSVVGGRLLDEFAVSRSGSYIARSNIDGVERVIAYRGVRGYPLIVTVGTAVDEVLAAYWVNRRSYIIVATAVSAVLLLVTSLVVIRQSRLSRAQEELRCNEANLVEKSTLLEATLEHMGQGIMMVDANRRVQVCNHRAMKKLGLPAELIATQPPLDAVLQWQWAQGEFDHDGADLSLEVRRFIMSGGSSDEPQVYERCRPNGRVLEIRSVPLESGGFVRTFADITERKETEARLRSALKKADQAAQAKSEFLATMSHEIRSPMSGLVGVVELLRETALDQDQRWMVGMIRSSSQNLLAVLNDILDFSKIEAGALTITMDSVNLRNLVAETAQSHAVEAASKGVNVHIVLDPNLPERVETDPLRLRQILTNLLSNAVKFTPAGTINLTVDCVGAPAKTVRLRVQDSGIGMRPEVLARLFMPFMQADGSTTRNFGGSGLGLCISDRLARLMDGTLSAESRLGEGSSFTLTLPFQPATKSAAGTLAATSELSDLSVRGHALVADDDATNRWLSCRQLTMLGWTVDAAEDGQAALTMFQRDRYDLLLTDCHMPKLDGVALAQAIRADADPDKCSLPIIGLTADATSAQRERCLAAGMSAIAIKPINRDQLSRLLNLVLPVQPIADQPQCSADERSGVLPPIFDQSTLRDLFSPGDPEVSSYVIDYLSRAADVEARLMELLNPPDPRRLDRAEIAAIAHRLCGSSLSIGAARLGAAAKCLEAAAPTANQKELSTFVIRIQTEIEIAEQAVSEFVRDFTGVDFV